MIPTARTIAGSILLALLVPTAAAGTPPVATFSATLEVSLKKTWSMRLGEIDWKCNGTKCQGRGATTDAEASCRALAGQLSPVKTFKTGNTILNGCLLPHASTGQVQKSNPPPGQVQKSNPPPSGGATTMQQGGSAGATTTVVVHPGGASPAAGSPANGSTTLGSSASVRSAAAAPIKTTDLVIEDVVWDYRGGGSKGHGPAPEAIGVVRPKVKVTIRNDGTARWASSGKVVVVMKPGTPRELAAAASGREGVSVASGGSGSAFPNASNPPFEGSGSIPGSLAPGAKKTVQFQIRGLHGSDMSRDLLRIEVDKYYTMKVDLRVSGEDQGKNDGADLVLRLNRLGQAVEPVLTQRRTDTSGRGTVEVRAPPGR